MAGGSTRRAFVGVLPAPRAIAISARQKRSFWRDVCSTTKFEMDQSVAENYGWRSKGECASKQGQSTVQRTVGL